MKLTKGNKITMIVTSIIILMPIIVGLIYWNELPKQVATHFGTDGKANGWSSKEFAVFGLPLILLVVHWLCATLTAIDPKSVNIGGKIYNLVLYICPVVSIIGGVSTYGYELGWNLDSLSIANIFMAIMFIVVGNYLPKCRPNYTIGIRIPWTLNDEENWNKTHRFAGKVWLIVGMLVAINMFLNIEILMVIFVISAILIPTLYSFVLYLKANK